MPVGECISSEHGGDDHVLQRMGELDRAEMVIEEVRSKHLMVEVEREEWGIKVMICTNADEFKRKTSMGVSSFRFVRWKLLEAHNW